MKITDKVKLNNKEYMCTQIIYVDNLIVYRIHEIFGNEELFIEKIDNKLQKITDKTILEEIYKLLQIKNTDIIVEK